VTLSAQGETAALLEKYAADVPELLIVSEVALADAAPEGATKLGEGLFAAVARASGNKCPRCWTFRPEVGAQPVCARCAEALG